MSARSKKIVEMAIRNEQLQKDGGITSRESSPPGSVSSSLEQMFDTDNDIPGPSGLIQRKKRAKGNNTSFHLKDDSSSSLSEVSGKDFSGSEDDNDYVPNPNDVSSSSSGTIEEGSFASCSENRPETLTDNIQQEVKDNQKKKCFPPMVYSSKKRKRNPHNWKTRKAALAREKGEAYFSYKNKLIPKKEIKDGILCRENCRLKCSSRFEKEDRLLFLQDFYKLDVNAKNVLLFKSIIKKPVQRQRKNLVKRKSASYVYSVTKNGVYEQVCKEALCGLYQIGRKKIDIIKNVINRGESAPPTDSRGQHSNRPNKIDEEVKKYVVEHIKKFPVEQSHYSRNRNPHKKYLSPLLNQTKMHKLYLEQCDDMPQKFKIKQCSYFKIFNTQFNLSFGRPKSDTCSTCDSGQGNDEHKQNYDAAIAAIKSDKSKSKRADNIMFLTMDLQQTMPLPKLTTSKAFYLRQMWFYNFGVHLITKQTEKAFFCTWTEDMANRGSSETCSALLRFIEVTESRQGKDHLIIWSDSCAGQNKNFHMVCLFQFLILKGYFRIIDHKFPEVGHTYLDSDRDFGRIEKVLRKNDTVYVPETYREIISTASKNNQVIDMADHFRKISELPDKLNLINRKKDELNEAVRFRDGIKWIRVEEYGSYLYKESYDDAMPFKKVNILKNIKRAERPIDFELERFNEKYGTISEEKKKNLIEQLKFIKLEYRYYYERIVGK